MVVVAVVVFVVVAATGARDRDQGLPRIARNTFFVIQWVCWFVV